MKKISILKYGAGNVTSIANSFTLAGHPVGVAEDKADILDSDILVMPGVGNASKALKCLKTSGHDKLLIERYNSGNLIVGICLGAQIMCEYLEEANQNGLGWIQGDVAKLGQKAEAFNNGWSKVDDKLMIANNLHRGINRHKGFYFNHGYKLPNNDRASIVINTKGNPLVPAIIIKKSIIGIQFHPEKSQRNGINLIRNIIEDYGSGV